MNYENYFKEFSESTEDYRKKVFLTFLIQNDENLLHEIGFSAHDVNQLNIDFKNILIEQQGNYLDYVKDQEEAINE